MQPLIVKLASWPATATGTVLGSECAESRVTNASVDPPGHDWNAFRIGKSWESVRPTTQTSPEGENASRFAVSKPEPPIGVDRTTVLPAGVSCAAKASNPRTCS